MGKKWFAVLLASAALVPVAYLAAPEAPAVSAARAVSVAPVVYPLSVSFVSASSGWLLGVTSDDCSASTGLVLRETTDAGLRWSAVIAPPAGWSCAGPSDGVSEVSFASSRNGWAYGPGLWATHDSGRTWRRIPVGGASVDAMAASADREIAVFSTTGGSDYRVYTSPVGTDDWRPVPGASGTDLAVDQASVAVAGRTGYVISGQRMLSGPVDGSRPWRRYTVPCGTLGRVDSTVAAGPAHEVIVTCGASGAHPTPSQVLRSLDGGKTWQRLADVVLYDPASSISVAPDGTILVVGIYNGALVSRDGGASWLPLSAVNRAANVGTGATISVGLVTNSEAFLLVAMQGLWLSYDAGLTWAR
jgi:photosystem II stability/assembly factor-like uncharacterized protein